MTGSDIIFYLLATLCVVFALLSVTTRQIFRAAIYLLFTLIGIAGIYFWLQYEFIAAVQIENNYRNKSLTEKYLPHWLFLQDLL